MADYLGQLETRFWLHELNGANRFVPPGAGAGTLQWRPASETVLAEVDTIESGGEDEDVVPAAPSSEDFLGSLDTRWSEADVWFDLAIVRPSSFDFGNILSTQTETITVYSSYRSQTIQLMNVVNNLGDGVSLPDLPGLPTDLEPQSGFEVTLEVTTDGPATLDDTLDFEFDVSTQQVHITGQRIVMFPFRPEIPVIEILEFLTDVLEHLDGSEQRIAARKNPRQIFELRLGEDGRDRRYLENLLYDWQSRVFGLPVWHEPSVLTAAASAGATSISVDDTTTGDFRVGSLAIVLTDRDTFDALEVQSIASNTLTFTSPLVNSYPVGTEVFPLRTAIAQPVIRGNRAPVNDLALEIRFRVLDNDVGDGFGDTSPFNVLNSKVLLDGPNVMDRRLSESLQRRMVKFDNLTGKHSQSSPWTRNRRVSVKGFVTQSRSELWKVRKLLHALRGRQISFYLPTFYDDLELELLLQSGSDTMNIVNVGFAAFAKSRAPSRGIIRIHLTDGTILTRTITAATEIDSDSEQLTVDTPWANDVQVDEVERIEYVELVRADTDRFRFEHWNANGHARLLFPVKAVFE